MLIHRFEIILFTDNDFIHRQPFEAKLPSSFYSQTIKLEEMEKKAGNAEAQVIFVPSYQQWSVMIIEIMTKKLLYICACCHFFWNYEEGKVDVMLSSEMLIFFRCWFFSGVNFSDFDFLVDFLRCWFSQMLIFSMFNF